MEKAYDLKELGLRAKEKGLIEAEDAALELYSVVKQWLKDSAALSSNPFDNMVIPFLDSADAVVLPQLDKIDGVQG